MSRGVARETWTIPTQPPGEWTRQAACRDADVGLFFPESNQPVTKALALCEACPVRPECLDYALDHGQVFGVWGATTPRQRQGRYRHRQARCGTKGGYDSHRRNGEDACERCQEAKRVYQRKWWNTQQRAGVG